MKLIISLTAVLQMSVICCFSQSVGIGTTTPASSAMLDIQSSAKGALIPRLTTVQRKAIVNPGPGLMVYDIDKNTIVFFDGSKWQRLVFKDAETSDLFTEQITDGETGDYFGNAVSINGDYAVVGAYMDDIGANVDQGSVFVFHKINGNWVQEAKLNAADGAAGDWFGSAVSVYGDYIVVGASGDDQGANTDQGSVYVYARNGTNWTQQHKFSDAAGATNDYFGSSVSISGNQFAAGAWGDDVGVNANQGSAIIFLLTGNVWAQEIKLTAADGKANDQFGASVSVSFNLVIIGAENATTPLSTTGGAAYIYFKLLTPWSLTQKLVNSTTVAGMHFGGAVAIDGNTAAVSEIYKGVTPPTIYGRVHIFLRGTFGIWNLQTVLNNPFPFPFYNFGESISLNGDRLVIGTINYGTGLSPVGDSSYVSVYKRTGTAWQEQNTFFGTYPAGNFGSSVFINGFNIVIGASKKKNQTGEVHFLNIE